MSQLLALEWDGSEARLVVAGSRGEQVVIEQAFSVTLGPLQPGEDQAEVDVGGQIAAALTARGISRIDTLVAVGRANIELRQLSLPPAPEDELPEMVRFQAMREFNQFDEDWLLDFVPIDEPEEGTRSVLAAAIGPELVGQIQETCERAGLTPQRLILRPSAAASLLGRVPTAGPAEPRLLVDLLSEEADLTVMIDRKVVFPRTTRLGGDPLEDADQRQALLAEIRRTIAAAESQLGGQRVGSIVLCGRGEPHAGLAKLIQEGLATPTELFDPFDGLSLGRELRKALPDHPGRFAPLLGMALAELEQTGHAIDFLHPRRRAEPPSRQKKYVLAGMAAVLLVISFFAYGWMQRAWLGDEISKLRKEQEKLEKEVAQAEAADRAVKEISKWTATDVVWLDEICRLSEKFPPAKEAMLTQLTIGSPYVRGGAIELRGLARSDATIADMGMRLRDGSHGMATKDSFEDQSTPPYQWQFHSSLSVPPEVK